MARDIRVRGVRNKEIDEEKLALAFLLLAKILQEDRATADAASGRTAAPSASADTAEAA